jgi:hypothetical protein
MIIKKIFALFLTIVIFGVFGYTFLFREKENLKISTKDGVASSTALFETSGCLKKGERADFTNDKSSRNGNIEVIIYGDDNKKNGSVVISDVPLTHYYPIEIHKCSVFAIRQFNLDYDTNEGKPGFEESLWKYDYSGNGKKVLVFGSKDMNGVYSSAYSYDFRIDPEEKYVSLIQGDFKKIPNALTIKDIKTGNTVFELLYNDLVKKYPTIGGDFGLQDWIEGGNVFFADVFDGAWESAFIRIDKNTWKYEVLLVPSNLVAGVERRINEKGYLAYTDIPTFTGSEEMSESIIADAIKEGKKKNLFVADLRTGEIKKIAETSPDKRFEMEWISNTELQYTLLDGTKKTFSITQ